MEQLRRLQVRAVRTWADVVVVMVVVVVVSGGWE